MTYRRTHFPVIDLASERFLAALALAQGGCAVSMGFVVQATMPIIKGLSQDDDEVGELVLRVYTLIPRAKDPTRWGGFALRSLRNHLFNLRRAERRRRARESNGPT